MQSNRARAVAWASSLGRLALAVHPVVVLAAAVAAAAEVLAEPAAEPVPRPFVAVRLAAVVVEVEVVVAGQPFVESWVFADLLQIPACSRCSRPCLLSSFP